MRCTKNTVYEDSDNEKSVFPFTKILANREYKVALAETPEQIDEVLALRYKVFNIELKQGLESSHLTGRDRDKYDEFCDQLIVIDIKTNKIVGTYRLHRFDRALEGHGFYSQAEFDLTKLLDANLRILEIGRACIDNEYRDGSVMNALWYGLASYMQFFDLEYTCGCVSLSTESTAETASLIYHYAKENNKLVHEKWRVEPNKNNQVIGFDDQLNIEITPKTKRLLPPLMRGYFAISCKLGGAPAYDHEFKVIDFFIFLRFSDFMQGPGRRFVE